MQISDISVFWIFIGILVWPELALCAVLWHLGHPGLGIIALVFGSTTSVKTVVREKIIDEYRRVARTNERRH